MLGTVLSLVVLGAIALLIGAFVLWRKGAPTKQVTLMVMMAVILVVNVLIWTVPTDDGESPIEKAGQLTQD